MLTPQERYTISQNLQRVHHNSVYGIAIKNFLAVFPSKTDEEVVTLMRGLQSQIDDNPLLMKEILGPVFYFFDTWKRTPKSLNIHEHTKYLVKAAMCRSKTAAEAARLLGISYKSFFRYKQQFNL